MEIITTKTFNGVQLDCYRAKNAKDEFWATREQIGRLLEYAEPVKSIAKIHERNQKRLDNFSAIVNLTKVEGSRSVTRDVIVYNFKGLLEICRYSQQPKADAVMDFLYDVADEIRQNGFYAIPQKIEEIIADPDSFIKILEALKAERQKVNRLTETVAIKDQQIAELKPKASYYDVVLACKDLLPISTISKDYGWSAKRMNGWLKEHGVQYKRGEIWLLYQNYAEQGYTSTKTHLVNGKDGTPHTKIHTYWTQKGRLFIHDLMKSEGNLPVMEQ